MTDQSALVLRVPAETARALREPELAEELREYLWRGVVISPSAARAAATVALEWLRDRLVVEATPERDRSPGVRLIEAERIRHLDRGDAAHGGDVAEDELAERAAWWLDVYASAIEWPGDLDTCPDRRHRRRVDELVVAGELVAAEIDRVLRAGGRPSVVAGEVVAGG